MMIQSKQSLVQAIRQAGFEKDLKADLRLKIISKLNSAPNNSEPTPPTLLSRLFLSLTGQFLSSKRLLKTRSVFSAQVGLQNLQLSRTQLLEMFNQSEVPSESVLQTLLKDKTIFRKASQSLGVQTSPIASPVEQDLQLFRIRQQSAQQFELRVESYKRQVEDRLNRQKDYQIQKLKDFFTAHIKLDQQERTHQLLEEYRQRLDKIFIERVRTLRVKQQQDQHTLKSKQQTLNQREGLINQFLARQKQGLQSRFDQICCKQRQTKKFMQLERERLSSFRDELTRRSKEIQLKQKLIEAKIQQSANMKYRLAQSNLTRREAQLSSKEIHVEKNYFKLKNYEELIQNLNQDLRSLKLQNQNLRIDIQNFKAHEKVLNDQIARSVSLITASDNRRIDFAQKFSEIYQQISSLKEVVRKNDPKDQLQTLTSVLNGIQLRIQKLFPSESLQESLRLSKIDFLQSKQQQARELKAAIRRQRDELMEQLKREEFQRQMND